MATLTVNAISRSGVTNSVHQAAASGGDDFAVTSSNKGKVFVEFINSNTTAARTITVTTPRVVDTLAVADRSIAVAASTTTKAGPWPSDTYKVSATNKIGWTYSSEADLTVAAFSLDRES